MYVWKRNKERKRPSVGLAFKGGVVRSSVVSGRNSFFVQQAKDFGGANGFCRLADLSDLRKRRCEIFSNQLESVFKIFYSATRRQYQAYFVRRDVMYCFKQRLFEVE